MDLGIKGRKAIVCAASKGLGRATAMELGAAGAVLTICARGTEALEATAAEIRRDTGATVTTVACDVTTDAGRAALLAACPAPDILVNNAGGPPPGDFKNFSLDDWRRAVESNMITPIALIQATVYGMMDRGFGRILNITSGSVKAPIPQLELSNGARAGLTGAVAVIARRAAARNVTINGLLPGGFETDRLRSNLQKTADTKGISLDAARKEGSSSVPAQRYGDPREFGATAAFLCSAHAGYITGQNILIDGGKYPGTL